MSEARDWAALEHLRARVLEPGERVDWKGRPDPAAVARMPSLVAPAILGFGVALFMGQVTLGALPQTAIVALFAFPFAAGGAWLAVRPVLFFRLARRSYYAVTDRRAIILTAGHRFRAISVPRDRVEAIERPQTIGGRGAVRFARHRPGAPDGLPTVRFSDGFWGLADVDAAARALGRD